MSLFLIRRIFGDQLNLTPFCLPVIIKIYCICGFVVNCIYEIFNSKTKQELYIKSIISVIFIIIDLGILKLLFILCKRQYYKTAYVVLILPILLIIALLVYGVYEINIKHLQLPAQKNT